MSSYLGQNFLTDTDILTRIASEVKSVFLELWCDTLIEIWPWKWALTTRISSLASQTLLIEYDKKMIEYLQTKIFPWLSTVPSLVNKDVLVRDETFLSDFPFGECTYAVKKKTLVVGNLPYYITSPILRKFFAFTELTRSGWVFLIQKEVAEKIVHNAPKKSFLRWLVNYAYTVEYCFSVPPEAFTPPPKVTSAVIRVLPKSLDEIPLLSYSKLLIFLDQYSPFKRKTLWASHKIVSKLSKKSDFDTQEFDINPYSHQRLEELGWDEMKDILET